MGRRVIRSIYHPGAVRHPSCSRRGVGPPSPPIHSQLKGENMTEVVVIGAGPAGMLAALRAGDLGAKTVLISRDEFGGMAANDGPVPVRTLAHAARLIRDARQLGRYGIDVSEPSLDYSRLLIRVREVAQQVREQSSFRRQIDSLGVKVHEQAGRARFADPHTIETESGLR